MQFHDSLIARLMDAYSTHGGFKDESRLRNVMRDMRVDVVKLPDGSLAVVYKGDSGRSAR